MYIGHGIDLEVDPFEKQEECMMRTIRHFVLMGLCACICNLILTHPCRGQHTHHVSELPVLVDGSKTPEKIPDELAYHHFLTAVAAPQEASPEEQKRQEAQLLPLGLTPEHRSQMIRTLATFKSQYDDLERRVGEVTQTPQLGEVSSRITSLRAQQRALVSSTIAEIRRGLSPDAAGRIDEYVQKRVKAKIVIYGTQN